MKLYTKSKRHGPKRRNIFVTLCVNLKELFVGPSHPDLKICSHCCAEIKYILVGDHDTAPYCEHCNIINGGYRYITASEIMYE